MYDDRMYAVEGLGEAGCPLGVSPNFPFLADCGSFVAAVSQNIKALEGVPPSEPPASEPQLRIPPSIRSALPVMNAAASEAR